MISGSLLRAGCIGMLFWMAATAARGQATDELDVSQLKKGDKLEVQNASDWVPGEYHEPNTAHSIMAIYGPFKMPAVVPLARVRLATPRTWTDATGKFTVKATLLRADKNGVVIRRDDGKEMTIPLSRLQKADREYLATFPNLAGEFPTAEEKKGARRGPPVALSETNLGEAPKVEYSSLTGAAWTYQPDAEPASKLPRQVRVPLKRTGSFMMPRDILLSPVDNQAFVVTQAPGGDANLDMSVQAIDLASGAVSTGLFSHEFVPLALSDDSKYILARLGARLPSGSGELRLYRRDGVKATPEKAWVPYRHQNELQSVPKGRNNAMQADIEWADFAGPDRVLSLSHEGELAAWSVPGLKAIAQALLPKIGRRPILSLGKKYLAVATLEGVALLQASDLKPAGFLPTPIDSFSYLAFSPSGKRLALVDDQRVRVWDLTTQKLAADFPVESSVGFAKEKGEAAWIDEKFLLLGSVRPRVIDVDNCVAVWTYSFMNPWTVLAGRTWYVTSVGLTTNLSTGTVPAPDIRKQYSQVAPEKLLAVRPGMEIALEIQTQDPHTAQVRQRIIESLAERGLKVVPQSEVKLIAWIGPPVIPANTPPGFSVSASPIARLRYEVAGKMIWQTTVGSNAVSEIRDGMAFVPKDFPNDSRLFEKMWIPVTVARPPADPEAALSPHPG